MKISIITITYNNLSSLRRTVESVTKQRFADWELIVIDGGSTDGTIEYLEDLSVSNLYYVSESDNGVYDAQNKGIRMARGEYCLFLNAGDVLYDERVLELMFADNSNADIIYGNEIVVDADGKRVEYCKGVENPTFLDLYMSCMKHQATFIRRNLFEKYGMYDDGLCIVADWEWFFRVIAYHDDITLQYKDVDVSLFENTGKSYHSPEICKTERQQVLNSYMSHRQQIDYDFFCRYKRLRDAERKPILTFCLRIIMWCVKHLKIAE